MVPEIITEVTGEINQIAKDRINQIVKTGGAKIERLAPKIIREAIEDVYKTPFRLPGKFGKEQFQKTKTNIFK